MSTLNAYIRSSISGKPVKVRFRYKDGRNIDIEYLSEIHVNPITWDSKKQQVKKSTKFLDEDAVGINKLIAERKLLLLNYFSKNNRITKLTSENLQQEIEKILNPRINRSEKKKEKIKEESFFAIFDRFLDINKLSERRIAQYQVVKRSLERFEYIQQLNKKSFKLTFDTISLDVLIEYEKFLYGEYEYAKNNKAYRVRFDYYNSYKPRGVNTVSGMLKKVRAFNNWAIKFEYTNEYPFKRFKFKEIIYGTPIFLTLNELEQIYYHDFHFNNKYETQRDIFIFQSLTGMRVGDMYKLTRANLINGFLHYIPEKTKLENSKTVIVPLNSIATDIIQKYESYTGLNLLPFISFQQYNYTIKDILTHVGIVRNVTVINPLTRNYELKPINKVVSSHMARRNFIANMYLHVQDQAMLSSLTGHVPNSKSFERYRQITDELKISLVKHLEFKK